MYLAHLKYILRKRDARVTGRKWELFQQAKLTAENYTTHISHIDYVTNVCHSHTMFMYMTVIDSHIL